MKFKSHIVIIYLNRQYKTWYDMNANWQFEHSYLELPREFYSPMSLQPTDNPELLIVNHSLAKELGLNIHDDAQAAWAMMLSGSVVPEGAKPSALAYAGHQFGHFTMLGDGRALWYGEHITPTGKRVDIQLKGSGPTPYARRGDGRAVLGPMLREYLISEAMHALGVPTTRSLAVVRTGERVNRGTLQPGAVLTRVAASHIRVGTFEFAATLPDLKGLHSLLAYTIKRHVPQMVSEDEQALALLEYVKQSQVLLICEWMRVGFIHGVMNTDNMAISGETIDYGPCAFMDEYHPLTVFSSIDHNSRYAFFNQPLIAAWNFARLAECLLALLHMDENKAIELAQDQVEQFTELFQSKWLIMMREKLGIVNAEEADHALIHELLKIMQTTALDYTNTFRDLSFDKIPSTLQQWAHNWQARRLRQPLSLQDSSLLMQRKNPALIPRNHQVEKALSLATQGDLFWFNRCLTAYQQPYINDTQYEDLRQPPTINEKVHETFCGT